MSRARLVFKTLEEERAYLRNKQLKNRLNALQYYHNRVKHDPTAIEKRRAYHADWQKKNRKTKQKFADVDDLARMGWVDPMDEQIRMEIRREKGLK